MCNINHPKFPCRICAKNVHDKDKAIQCKLCELWIYIKCNKLNYLYYSYLQNCDESWYCIHCCSTIFPFNSLSSNKNFLACCTNTDSNITQWKCHSETRITKQVSSSNNLNLNDYSFEFTPTETSAGGTLLYTANHLSYKCPNDLNIYKKTNLNLLLLKLSIQKNQIFLWESFPDIHLWTFMTLIAITYTNY